MVIAYNRVACNIELPHGRNVKQEYILLVSAHDH